MMIVPAGVRVHLALGYTDMMGWTPLAPRPMLVGSVRREDN